MITFESVVQFPSNYGRILYHFQDKGSYLSKIAISYVPFAFDAPVGALKMREWKMQEWKMQERQSMESHQKKIL